MRATMRRYAGPDDLRAMQDLTQRLWSLRSTRHVGDLAWGRFMFPPETIDGSIVLWERHGRVVAWAWAVLPDDLRTQVDPDFPELAQEALDWFDKLAAGGPREFMLLDTETDLCGLLLRRGYEERRDAPFFTYHARSLGDLPEPVLPAGFAARPVRGKEDLERRVEVHRAAWNSKRVTTSSYQAVMGAWPYRADLDWVVEGPDGRFAANCLIWYDDRNRVGLIEPVGTAPRYRRRGLARAVCLAALHALREAGGDTAIVYPRGDAAYPIPRILYQSMGFRPYARTRTYVKTG